MHAQMFEIMNRHFSFQRAFQNRFPPIVGYVNHHSFLSHSQNCNITHHMWFGPIRTTRLCPLSVILASARQTSCFTIKNFSNTKQPWHPTLFAIPWDNHPLTFLSLVFLSVLCLQPDVNRGEPQVVTSTSHRTHSSAKYSDGN